MMSDLLKQKGIEAANAAQWAKNHKHSKIKWVGSQQIYDRVMKAIEAGATSIVGYCADYEEPDLDEVEQQILIEQAWGGDEFEMNFRIPPDSLGDFEITLRYPSKRNPRKAGRKKTGHRVDLTISGLSDKAFEKLQELAKDGKRSAYVVSLIEADLSRSLSYEESVAEIGFEN